MPVANATLFLLFSFYKINGSQNLLLLINLDYSDKSALNYDLYLLCVYIRNGAAKGIMLTRWNVANLVTKVTVLQYVSILSH